MADRPNAVYHCICDADQGEGHLPFCTLSNSVPDSGASASESRDEGTTEFCKALRFEYGRRRSDSWAWTRIEEWLAANDPIFAAENPELAAFVRRAGARSPGESGGHTYPHMCRDGHEEIGWRGDHEQCPLCRTLSLSVDAEPWDAPAIRREMLRCFDEYCKAYGRPDSWGMRSDVFEVICGREPHPERELPPPVTPPRSP